ncbi:hypothetical protein EIP91_009238 [Steccherinum ochraceum]|uniref:Uncharacterized protein n=1 Tax=Steccherinum ochraceum TaxID=92696 RepID=A0A4R0R4K1_9APHY|nr:hypothetical protein EIP91_009238 [Steccherinum ochraceum]
MSICHSAQGLWQPVQQPSRPHRSKLRLTRHLIVTMRFTAVLAGFFVVVASSAIAVPVHSSEARGLDEHAVVARYYDLVARDILQAIHARELAMNTRSETRAVLLRRGNKPSSGSKKSYPVAPPSSGSGGTAPPPFSETAPETHDPAPPTYGDAVAGGASRSNAAPAQGAGLHPADPANPATGAGASSGEPSRQFSSPLDAVPFGADD